MRLLYELIVLVAGLLLLPVAFVLGIAQGRAGSGALERVAHYPSALKRYLQQTRVILIHAVSVGEVKAAAPLIRVLQQEYPQHLLVLTSTTFTGRQIAEEMGLADVRLFFPLDLSLVMRRFFRRLNPELVLLVETELWPNFLRRIRRRAIPLVLVNGRISKRSWLRYRYLRPWLKPMLAGFSSLCMQDRICARRIRSLGAPEARIQVTGNIKFDLPLDDPIAPLPLELLEQIPADTFVWIGGSTHAGEDELLLDCHRQLRREGFPSFLILAPRHPKRFERVAELLRASDVPFVRRTQLGQKCPGTELILLDSIGELDRLYARAQLVFIGGSLVPVGGHNPLEASRYAVPVLYGPHMENFMEISRLLTQSGGAQQVDDREALLRQLRHFCSDEEDCRRAGLCGRKLLEQNSGATERTLVEARRFLTADSDHA